MQSTPGGQRLVGWICQNPDCAVGWDHAYTLPSFPPADLRTAVRVLAGRIAQTDQAVAKAGREVDARAATGDGQDAELVAGLMVHSGRLVGLLEAYAALVGIPLPDDTAEEWPEASVSRQHALVTAGAR
jgi:hypothetical protein